MGDGDKFYFTKEQLENSPSRSDQISEAKELLFRQQAANFIQYVGQCLQLNQLCINTATVYMHRFFVSFSFAAFRRNRVCLAALFLAAKVAETPRKMEMVIKVADACTQKDKTRIDVNSDVYQNMMEEIAMFEFFILAVLGCNVELELPHVIILRICDTLNANKELSQISYIFATISLQLTTMCLLYKPAVVAITCIQLACKWSDFKVESKSAEQPWFSCVDQSMTAERLEVLVNELIAGFDTNKLSFRKILGKKALLLKSCRLLNEPSTSQALLLKSCSLVNEPSTSQAVMLEKPEQESEYVQPKKLKIT